MSKVSAIKIEKEAKLSTQTEMYTIISKKNHKTNKLDDNRVTE